MIYWLGAPPPAVPPKQILFGSKSKPLPGFGGAPGSGPSKPTPPKKSSSIGWVIGLFVVGVAIVAARTAER